MDTNAEMTVKAVSKVVEHFKDGFQFSDILAAVRTAMELAETFTGLPKEDRKEFVIDVVRKAYKEVDPNIPWIPEPIESWVEGYILNNLVPSAIQLVIDATKGKVNVNQGAA